MKLSDKMNAWLAAGISICAYSVSVSSVFPLSVFLNGGFGAPSGGNFDTSEGGAGDLAMIGVYIYIW